MSRTAGLGSGDYVAINNTAILALILGALSILALLFDVMLLVALAAVVCGILALTQIRSSNGTQSGRTFAIVGMLLGLGLGGWGVKNIAMARIQHRDDERAIGQLVKRLSDFLSAGQYDQAYQSLFSDGFKKDFDEKLFASRWEAFTSKFGPVKSVGWGERAIIERTRGTDLKRGWASSEVTFEHLDMPPRQTMSFVYSEGEWMIDGIEQLFEKVKGQGAQEGDGGAPPLDPSRPAGPEFTPPAPGPTDAPAPANPLAPGGPPSAT
jgi:hypothetical protein